MFFNQPAQPDKTLFGRFIEADTELGCQFAGDGRSRAAAAFNPKDVAEMSTRGSGEFVGQARLAATRSAVGQDNDAGIVRQDLPQCVQFALAALKPRQTRGQKGWQLTLLVQTDHPLLEGSKRRSRLIL